MRKKTQPHPHCTAPSLRLSRQLLPGWMRGTFCETQLHCRRLGLHKSARLAGSGRRLHRPSAIRLRHHPPGGATPHAVFQRVLSPWLHLQALPVVMAGMVGSNAGWIEAPYLPCPASLDALAGQLQPVTEAWPVKAWIVPGLSVNRHENHNVMRGEETQLLGAYRERPAPYYVLPGTHSKWAQLDGARVLDFRTVMTGELHHLLLSQSLIGAGLPAQRAAPEWFQRGLQSGLTDRNILRACSKRAAPVCWGNCRPLPSANGCPAC